MKTWTDRAASVALAARCVVAPALALCCAILLGGCTSYSAVALVPSTSPITGEYDIKGRAKGTACQDYLFGLIAIGAGPDTVEEALRGARGPLVRVTVDVESTFWVIGSTRCVIVAGHTIQRIEPAVPAPLVPAPAAPAVPGASAVESAPAPMAPATDRLALRRAVEGLSLGQSVRLILADGRQVEGLVRARNDIKLQLETESGPVTVKRNRITRIEAASTP